MAAKELDGMRVAILVADGFERVELIQPRKALDKVGAETKVVSPALSRPYSTNDQPSWIGFSAI
jgi:deglycase